MKPAPVKVFASRYYPPPIGIWQVNEATGVVPSQHCLPETVEERLADNKHIDIAGLRVPTRKRIRIKTETHLGTSDDNDALQLKVESRTDMSSQCLQHARVLLRHVDIAAENMIHRLLFRRLMSQ